MPVLDRRRSVLCLIDFQERLMKAIDGAEEVVANAGRLLAAAEQLDVPVLLTEQNPTGLGPTVSELARPAGKGPVGAKVEFDACRARGVSDAPPPGHHLARAGCAARRGGPP